MGDLNLGAVSELMPHILERGGEPMVIGFAYANTRTRWEMTRILVEELLDDVGTRALRQAQERGAEAAPQMIGVPGLEGQAGGDIVNVPGLEGELSVLVKIIPNLSPVADEEVGRYFTLEYDGVALKGAPVLTLLRTAWGAGLKTPSGTSAEDAHVAWVRHTVLSSMRVAAGVLISRLREGKRQPDGWVRGGGGYRLQFTSGDTPSSTAVAFVVGLKLDIDDEAADAAADPAYAAMVETLRAAA